LAVLVNWLYWSFDGIGELAVLVNWLDWSIDWTGRLAVLVNGCTGHLTELVN
jgi:hypothetical protein